MQVEIDAKLRALRSSRRRSSGDSQSRQLRPRLGGAGFTGLRGCRICWGAGGVSGCRGLRVLGLSLFFFWCCKVSTGKPQALAGIC